MSGSVGGLTIATAGLTVSATAQVRASWPYAPGWFEKPQTIAGTAQILGDIELRGANRQVTAGTYCGFVDVNDAANCSGADVTLPPPYTWRP